MELIRLFIVDDHELIRAGLRRVLEIEDDIEVVGEASNADEALAGIEAAQPSVVLMDINLKGSVNGFEVTKKILEKHSDINVIILTVYEPDQYIIEAVRAGAVGYLLKEVDGAELIAAIRKVAAGETLIDPELSRQVMNHLATMRQKLSSLTRREREILDKIGEGKSNKEIADELCISEGTIKNHITSLFRKLDVHGRTQAALMAWRDEALS